MPTFLFIIATRLHRIITVFPSISAVSPTQSAQQLLQVEWQTTNFPHNPLIPMRPGSQSELCVVNLNDIRIKTVHSLKPLMSAQITATLLSYWNALFFPPVSTFFKHFRCSEHTLRSELAPPTSCPPVYKHTCSISSRQSPASLWISLPLHLNKTAVSRMFFTTR